MVGSWVRSRVLIRCRGVMGRGIERLKRGLVGGVKEGGGGLGEGIRDKETVHR